MATSKIPSAVSPAQGQLTDHRLDSRGNQPVGYMVPVSEGWAIVGRECCATEDTQKKYTPIYHVNIYAYRQTCGLCGRVLVEGAQGWPELFDGRIPEAVRR